MIQETLKLIAESKLNTEPLDHAYLWMNDKFRFSNDEDGIYEYHGVRSSINSTYTSSITRNITFDLIECIGKGLLFTTKSSIIISMNKMR